MLVWKCDHFQCSSEAPAMVGDIEPPDDWIKNRDGIFCSPDCADDVGRENDGDRRYHEMKEDRLFGRY
jgi:hypothetical protein